MTKWFYVPLQQVLAEVIWENKVFLHLVLCLILVLFLCAKTYVMMLLWNGDTELKMPNTFRQ